VVLQVEEGARAAFAELNGAFSSFLGATGALCDLERIPFCRTALACYFELAVVGDRQHRTDVLERAAWTLEGDARRLGEGVLAASEPMAG